MICVYLCDRFILTNASMVALEAFLGERVHCTVSIPREFQQSSQDTIERMTTFEPVVLGSLPTGYKVPKNTRFLQEQLQDDVITITEREV